MDQMKALSVAAENATGPNFCAKVTGDAFPTLGFAMEK